MERRRIKHIDSLEERLASQARCLREVAKSLPPGSVREDVIRRAQQADTASKINQWLSSPPSSIRQQ